MSSSIENTIHVDTMEQQRLETLHEEQQQQRLDTLQD